MVIPNMEMEFNYFDIFYQIWYIFDLSSALACRMVSVNINIMISSKWTSSIWGVRGFIEYIIKPEIDMWWVPRIKLGVCNFTLKHSGQKLCAKFNVYMYLSVCDTLFPLFYDLFHNTSLWILLEMLDTSLCITPDDLTAIFVLYLHIDFYFVIRILTRDSQAAATQYAKSFVFTFVDRNLFDLGCTIDHEIQWWYDDGDWIIWRPLTVQPIN